MRLGLVARADRTGLGVQTYGFYKHLQPAKTLVIDLSHLNRQKNDFSLYPDASVLRHTPYPETHTGHPGAKEAIDAFLEDIDLVLTCETPYDYHLFAEARRRGIKTVLQYNFELLDHLREPKLPQPDLFVAPSLWRYDDVPFRNKVFIPVPVDREKFHFRRRTSVQTFLHVVGNPAMEDRNGTQRLMEAWQHVKTDARLVVHTQWPLRNRDPRITVNTVSYDDNADLYKTGDVVVIPRKFGGLCLPVNEAMSVGMPVVMTDLAPQNEFLHPAGLIPASRSHEVMAKTMIDIFEPDVHAIADRVDELVRNPELVTAMSDHSDKVAGHISWPSLRPIYLRAFESVLAGSPVDQAFSWAS